MSLTPEQLLLRDGKVTASFAPYLMAGDDTRILREWRRLVGHPSYEAEDVSANWPVHFGSYIEPFALDWHQNRTGQPLVRRGEVVTHPAMPHVCCTLDAYRASDAAVIDCKALSGFRKLDEACQFYTPQMIVQTRCTKAQRAALLIIHGGAEPKEYPIEWPADYESLVWERIGQFWQSVLDLAPPVEMSVAAAPIPAVKTYDMAANNQWPVEAAAWLETRMQAKRFNDATSELKKLVPPDAGRCHGHGIEITRSKAGALTIKELRP